MFDPQVVPGMTRNGRQQARDGRKVVCVGGMKEEGKGVKRRVCVCKGGRSEADGGG